MRRHLRALNNESLTWAVAVEATNSARMNSLRAKVSLLRGRFGARGYRAAIQTGKYVSLRDVKAARVTRFGPPSAIAIEDLPRPEAGAGQLVVRVKAAGVGNWDALIRSGKITLQPLPIILGSELAGIVESVGANVSGF